MAVSIQDSITGLKAKVIGLFSTPADGALLVNPPTDPDDAGFTVLACESDAGDVTGVRRVRTIDVSQDYRMRTGVDSLLFNAKFPGAAIDTGRWFQNATTQTITVANGFLNLNAGLSVATTTHSLVRSYRCFPIYGTFGLWAEAQVQLSQTPVVNNQIEVGLFLAATNAAPTDGVFMRINSSGEGRMVINFAGTETQSSAFTPATYLPPNVTKKVVIGIFSDSVELWIDDVLIVSLAAPAAQGDVTASAMLPFSFRNQNTGACSAAQVLKVGMVNVTLADANAVKLWSHTMSGLGGMGYEGQAGGTLGSTALYTNSLAAGSGVAATNTTAALGSGLGGQFSLLPSLAVPTDGIISSYQVPAGTAALPGKCLYIRGVKVQGVVTTVLAGGPVIGAFSVAYGHTSVSLATTEAAGAKAPRRIPIGIQVYAANAAVGARDDRELFLDLETPICVQPGEFFQVVMKNLGTVTTTGVITFLIHVDAYWE